MTARIPGVINTTNPDIHWETGPIESMDRDRPPHPSNVRRWRQGDMRKQWTAAGMLQAEQQFRRIIGYSDLARFITAIERRQLTPDTPVNLRSTDSESAAAFATV